MGPPPITMACGLVFWLLDDDDVVDLIMDAEDLERDSARTGLEKVLVRRTAEHQKSAMAMPAALRAILFKFFPVDFPFTSTRRPRGSQF